MNFNQIVIETFLLEQTEGNKLLLLDIDDTLLTAEGMKIYKKLPNGEEKALTPEEYAAEKVTPDTKHLYDYRDFKDPEKVKNSIKFGNPIIPNLQVMDKFVKNGWKLGILTARSLENEIYEAIQKFLKIRNAKGELEQVGDKIARDMVFAVNDIAKKYDGETDFEKKKNVMKSLVDKYDKVWLIDDDPKNLKAVNDLKAELKEKGETEKAKKLFAVQAKKPD